jgi:hypothetical protein
MEYIKLLLEIEKKGLSGPLEIIFFIVILALLINSLVIKYHKIITYTDFDRILLPKNERSIQHIIVKVHEYFTFSFLYLIFGVVNSIIFTKVIIISDNFHLSDLINWIFNTSLMLIMLNVLFKNYKWTRKLEKIKWLNIILIKDNRYSFNINFYSSFAIYTFLVHIYIFDVLIQPQKNLIVTLILTFIVLLLLPMFLLYLYRSYYKKNNYEYICNFISEKEFNDSMLFVDYTLDKERIIFRKPDDSDYSVIIMYDRSADKYYKFTRVNII